MTQTVLADPNLPTIDIDALLSIVVDLVEYKQEITSDEILEYLISNDLIAEGLSYIADSDTYHKTITAVDPIVSAINKRLGMDIGLTDIHQHQINYRKYKNDHLYLEFIKST